MSIINLGMQCIGVMCSKVSDNTEKVIEKCKNLKHIRKGCSDLKEEILESVKPAKELIASVMQRLKLKGKKFEFFSSSSDQEMPSLWGVLLDIELLLTRNDITKACLLKLPSLQKFMEHCCTFRKYSITIKKCGKNNCTLCKPVQMDKDLCKGLSNVHVN